MKIFWRKLDEYEDKLIHGKNKVSNATTNFLYSKLPSFVFRQNYSNQGFMDSSKQNSAIKRYWDLRTVWLNQHNSNVTCRRQNTT